MTREPPPITNVKQPRFAPSSANTPMRPVCPQFRTPTQAIPALFRSNAWSTQWRTQHVQPWYRGNFVHQRSTILAATEKYAARQKVSTGFVDIEQHTVKGAWYRGSECRKGQHRPNGRKSLAQQRRCTQSRTIFSYQANANRCGEGPRYVQHQPVWTRCQPDNPESTIVSPFKTRNSSRLARTQTCTIAKPETQTFTPTFTSETHCFIYSPVQDSKLE